MTAAGVPAKEISGLQHEVASLARRQGVLEDELIEVMEQRETAEAEVARVGAKLAEIDAERAAAVAARDAALVEIDRGIADKTVTRTSAAAAIPAELLALYDKIREASGGIGAARLHQRRCEGCRLELAGSELGAVRNARVDAVLRCENCRRILVRTHESGL